MNPLEKSKLLLKKYLKETPKDVLNQKFAELNNAKFEGGTVMDYFMKFENQYSFFGDKLEAFSYQKKQQKTIVYPTETFLVQFQSSKINTEQTVDFKDEEMFYAKAI
jgi:hypothetical protein